MPSLFEQARPRAWQDVAGQDRAVAQVRKVLGRGWGGRAFWIAGPSGQGKTTIARLIADDGADSWATWEIDGQDCTMDYIRDMVDEQFACRSLGVGGKCWIINEAQGMRAAIADRFLTALEGMPDHCCIIFTSSKPVEMDLFGEAHYALPFYSRCVVVTLKDGPAVRQALARRAKAVAVAHGCDGLPDWTYDAGIDHCQGNLRALLQAVESGQLADVARAELTAYLNQPTSKQDGVRRAECQARLAELEGA